MGTKLPAREVAPPPAPVWEVETSDERRTVWRLVRPLVPEVRPRVEATAAGVRVTGCVWDWMNPYEVAQLRAVLSDAQLTARLYADRAGR